MNSQNSSLSNDEILNRLEDALIEGDFALFSKTFSNCKTTVQTKEIIETLSGDLNYSSIRLTVSNSGSLAIYSQLNDLAIVIISSKNQCSVRQVARRKSRFRLKAKSGLDLDPDSLFVSFSDTLNVEFVHSMNLKNAS